MEQQQQMIQQQAQLIEQLQQENQHQQVQHQQSQQIQELQQQNLQLQQQGNAPSAEEQQVEKEQEEPPPPPPLLPEISDAMVSACQSGDTGKIISLIEAGESPNSVDAHGYTPVVLALLIGRLSAVKVLFGFGADLSIVDGNGGNILHVAAKEGNIDAINWLLDNSSIDIDSTNNHGSTAALFAMWSVWDYRLKIVMLLVERGALLSIVDRACFTMLRVMAIKRLSSG
jgi:ankyrin repeat protein